VVSRELSQENTPHEYIDDLKHSNFLNNDDRVIILVSMYMFLAMPDPMKLSKLCKRYPLSIKTRWPPKWPPSVPKICKKTSNFLNKDDRVIILVSRYMFSAMPDPMNLSKIM